LAPSGRLTRESADRVHKTLRFAERALPR